MQVGESTLKKLVEGQKQFQVPLYQRQYAWDTAQLKRIVHQTAGGGLPERRGFVPHSAA